MCLYQIIYELHFPPLTVRDHMTETREIWYHAIVQKSVEYHSKNSGIHRFFDKRDITIQIFELRFHSWVPWAEIEKSVMLQSCRHPSITILSSTSFLVHMKKIEKTDKMQSCRLLFSVIPWSFKPKGLIRKRNNKWIFWIFTPFLDHTSGSRKLWYPTIV